MKRSFLLLLLLLLRLARRPECRDASLYAARQPLRATPRECLSDGCDL